MSVRSLSLVSLLTLSLVGAGSGTAAQRSATCLVGVYLVRTHTVAEKQRIAATLRADPLIASVRYVTKAQALAAMRRRFPDLVQNLTSNPLPDSFSAVPKAHVTASLVILELRARKLRGVLSVTGHTPDGGDCGP